MKKSLKVLLIGILAFALTACAQIPSDSNGNKSHINSNNGDSYYQPEDNTTNKINYAPIDEIVNAKLNSGLIQLNNDIFQQGGYINVADFVDKYKDKYDFTYWCPGGSDGTQIKKGGTYENCKDYLIEYNDDIFDDPLAYINWDHHRWGERWENFLEGLRKWKYYLKLTPKNGDEENIIKAYVVNATSPDEKITLDKAIVASLDSCGRNNSYTALEWFPGGFNDYHFDNFESCNHNYTVKTIKNFLESQGFSSLGEERRSDLWSTKDYENIKRFWEFETSIGSLHEDNPKGNHFIAFEIVGKENLFGANPFYYGEFCYDSNTDKIKSCKIILEFFIKDSEKTLN